MATLWPLAAMAQQPRRIRTTLGKACRSRYTCTASPGVHRMRRMASPGSWWCLGRPHQRHLAGIACTPSQAAAAAATASQATKVSAPERDSPSTAAGQQRAYPFDDIEKKWQRIWDERKTFRTPELDKLDTTKEKFYVLDMFPYPSGSGLHVGHPEGYTATDIIARYKRMKGFNVMHPMGWDAFGLPAEQFAIDTGTHPRETTKKNIARFKQQLKSLGFSYDWDRELSTTDPDYFKWTQWIFLKLHEKGLAYQAEVPVNFCPKLGTVLANEEVIDGVSERGGHPVIRVPMKQWMLKITKYADRLLEDLDELDWSDSIKEMQRNWIGRSEGTQIKFRLKDSSSVIETFTTRPDTVFGVTYVVLAPEHDLVKTIVTDDCKSQVEDYVESARRKSDLERTGLQKTKTGVFTGAYAINPVNNEEVPIWVADYVLGSYGSGAVMAVPAHDDRDFEFARQFGLGIRYVVSGGKGGGKGDCAFTGEGVSVNSDAASFPAGKELGLCLNDLDTQSAKKEVTDWLESTGLGSRKVNYKLRDWLFARQRYWGEPFPIVFEKSPKTGEEVAIALAESDLPVELPEVDSYHPNGTGESPLASVHEWVNTSVPGTESGQSVAVRRDTNTMPQWAGSCWYYLRFLDPQNGRALVDPEKEKYWMPVDLYVGGAEHAVLHLLYARFWHKVLYDLGVVSTKEPFRRLVSQGMILGEVEFTAQYDNKMQKFVSAQAPGDGVDLVELEASQVTKKGKSFVLKDDPSVVVSARSHKMSKSRGNVVNPDDVVEAYGADSLRLYEMFMGPLRETKIWSTRSVEGVHRFLTKVWRSFGEKPVNDEVEASSEQKRLIHKCIKRVTTETEELRFNTAISAMMEFMNEASKWETNPREVVEPFVLMLSCYAPHIAEEIWNRMGRADSLTYHDWPVHDEALLVEDQYILPVQVNGKMRGSLEVPMETDEKQALDQVKEVAKISKWIEGKQVVKVIFVPQKILNVIVK